MGVAKKLYHVDGLEKSPRHKQKIDDQLKLRHDAFDLIGDSGAVLGVALRTGNDSKNPVYVSIGHRSVFLRSMVAGSLYFGHCIDN